jgi:Protein of unknown function (DUF2281)
MAVDRNKLDDLLKRLPDDLQDEVLQFAELLLHRNDDASAGNGPTPVRSFFGIWDSGDSRSADNDRIDADLATNMRPSEGRRRLEDGTEKSYCTQRRSCC